MDIKIEYRSAELYHVDNNNIYVSTSTEQIRYEVNKACPPAGAYLDKPIFAENEVPKRINNTWVNLTDLRGTRAVKVATKESSVINYVGPLKTGYTLTLLPLHYEYYKYDSDTNSWIIDESTKNDLLLKLAEEINSETDQKIYTGFSYQNINFYLSMENQFNYKSLMDDAEKNNLEYPATIKGFGLNDFLQFQNKETLKTFYDAGKTHIKKCITDGWDIKKGLEAKTMDELIALI